MEFYIVKGKFCGFYLVMFEHGQFAVYFRERPFSVMKALGIFKESYFAVKTAEIYGAINTEGKRAMRHANSKQMWFERE